MLYCDRLCTHSPSLRHLHHWRLLTQLPFGTEKFFFGIGRKQIANTLNTPTKLHNDVSD